MYKIRLFILVIGATFLGGFPLLVKAEGSLLISPALQELTFDEFDQSQQVDFQITNPTDESKTYLLRTVDFGNLDQTGGKLFQGQQTGDASALFPPASWIVLPEESITLNAHETQTLSLEAVNQETLSPGSHYGSVFLETQEPDTESDRVHLRQVAAPLIFITKINGGTEKLSLTHIDFDQNWYGGVRTASLTFQNRGNVYARPYGVVALVNPLGKIIHKQPINEKSDIFFPGEESTLPVTLKPLFPFLPGTYTIVVKYHYGEKGDFVDEVTFHTYTGAIVGSIAMVLGGAALLNWHRRKKILMTAKKDAKEG